MIFDSSSQTVFVDTDTPPLQSDATFNVILSPSYYWVKRLALPVRYLHEVKKLLPSLFEEILPEGKYSYSAYRDGEEYLLFAYNDKAILDALGEKGIKPAQIKKVYFAQSEFGGSETPIALEGNSVLTRQNGVIIKLPSVLVEGAQPYDMAAHKLSKQGVELARYAHIADRKSQMLVVLFMGLLIVLFAFEWTITVLKASEIDKERSALFEKHGLQQTLMQNRAVLNSLEKRYERQIKIRTLTAALLGITLQKEESLQRYVVEDSKMTVEFALTSSARAKAFTAALKRADAEYKEQYENGILRLEVVL